MRMLLKEKWFRCFNELGDKINIDTARKWMKKTFNEEASESKFYLFRKEFRRLTLIGKLPIPKEVMPQGGKEEMVKETIGTQNLMVGQTRSDAISNLQQEESNKSDILLHELRKVRSFAKEVGGMDRLKLIIAALEEFTS